MGLRYVSKLLFSEKSQIANNSAATEARENIRTYLESLEFYKFFMFIWLNLKTIKFYLIKLATYFY
jgi:hypothetical protein